MSNLDGLLGSGGIRPTLPPPSHPIHGSLPVGVGVVSSYEGRSVVPFDQTGGSGPGPLDDGTLSFHRVKHLLHQHRALKRHLLCLGPITTSVRTPNGTRNDGDSLPTSETIFEGRRKTPLPYVERGRKTREYERDRERQRKRETEGKREGVRGMGYSRGRERK